MLAELPYRSCSQLQSSLSFPSSSAPSSARWGVARRSLLAALLMLLALALAGADAAAYNRAGTNKHYRSCGNMLIRRLQEVCEHRFADPFHKARLQRMKLIANSAERVDGADMVTRASHHHHHRNARAQRALTEKPPQVADACCLQTCSDAFIREHVCDISAQTADAAAEGHMIIVKRSVAIAGGRWRRRK